MTFALMGEILQIRLREEIREELGGTYGVSVSASTSSIPDSEYQIYAYFGSDPDRVEELFAAIQRELNWLIDGGEQKYLDTAKELFRSAREEQVEENSFWLSQIGSLMRRGLPLDIINSYLDRLDAVTLEEVSAAAERYLTLDQYIRVVLFPQEEE
ncbi:MAG: insulinase family protein [Chloroflexi bacterium]|nr:insulinase family protein [Chloroflexota bacterium]